MTSPKTIKQKIIEMLGRLPDDIDYDRAVESIWVMRKIEAALREDDAALMDHDEFMRELLAEDEEVPRHLDAAS
jgi:hypothetical protein